MVLHGRQEICEGEEVFSEGGVHTPAGVGKARGWLFARGRVSFSSDVQILAEVGMVIVFDDVSQRLNRQIRMDAI